MKALLPPLSALIAAGMLYATSEAIRRDDVPVIGVEDLTLTRDAGTADEQNLLSLARPSPTDVSAILERPLFSESRRPRAPIAETPAPDPAPAEPPPEPEISQPLEGIVLLGTMYADGWRALIRESEGTTERWMRIGDNIGQWSLERIDGEEVEFRQGESVFTVRIER